MAEVVVVEAVGTAAGHAGQIKTDFARVMEDAMTQAVLVAHADGLANDPDATKARIETARVEVKKQYGIS